MTKPDMPAHESPSLAALRQALAISRLMALQKKLENEAQKVGYDADKRTDFLQGLYEEIHREAYYDWRHRPGSPYSPGQITDPKKRADLRKIIQSLGDPKNDKPLFNANGYVIHYGSDDIAGLLADFYYKIRELKPFNYGNELTLDFFIQVLGSMPAFRANYGGIDLRRMDEPDVRNLHDPKASRSKLGEAFKHALNPSRTPHLENKRDGYPAWPMQEVEIEGLKFLSYKDTKHGECLVRVDGGLIPLGKIRNELTNNILSNRQLADFPAIRDSQIVGYVPGTEKLRIAVKGDKEYDTALETKQITKGQAVDKEHIDGFAISKDAAPLFCLDANILTGLTTARHHAFISLVKKTGKDGEKTSLHELNDSGNGEAEKFKQQLLVAAKDDPSLRRSVMIAYDHINRITQKLDHKRLIKFEGKSSLQDTKKTPRIFICMGGAGSGKSSAAQAAQIHCGQNFVVASLDEFRKDSDLYTVLTSAGHHGDDYDAVEPFANALRTWVAQHAKKNKFNLLYDGSGIEFVDKYQNLVRDFKKNGYETEVIGAERAIDVAVDAIIDRAQGKDGRTLPWRPNIERHSQMPGSFMAAVEEDDLKVSLFALDDRKDFSKDYLMAESFVLTDKEMNELKESQSHASITSHFKNFIKERPDSFLKRIAGKQYVNKKGETETIPDIGTLLGRIPDFSDDNVTYIAYSPAENVNRVLAIYDARRFEKMMQKSALNTEASDLKEKDKPPDSVRFLPHGSWKAAVGSVDNNTPRTAR